MPHLTLRILHVRTGHLQPDRVRGSEATPIYPTETQPPGRRLYEASENVVVGTITRQYDGLDDLTYESNPQRSINYQFDSAGRRKTMTVTGQAQVNYSYDSDSHLTQISQGSSTVQLSYDAAGRRSLLVLPNGVRVAYSYDANSRLTGITYQNGGTMLGNITYGNDALGRHSQLSGSFARINVPSPVSAASYNAANQLVGWGSTSLSYDLNGNLQSDGTNTYTWDLRNQLSAIAGGSTATFQYDGLRRRTSKTINGTSTAFLYDNWNIVQELSGSAPTANLIIGFGLDQIFTRTDSTGTKNFLDDGLGSILALTNATGTVQSQYTYDPFGNVTASGASSTNAFQYTARENDGTDLYFYRARYYKPSFQRFASEDPIGVVGGINLFSYVGDDPIRYIDPFGLDPQNGTPNCGTGGNSGGSGGGPNGPGSGPNDTGNPNGSGNPRPISAGVNGPGFRLVYTLDPANNTLWLTYGLGLSTSTGTGGITWPGRPSLFPGPKAPSTGQSNSGSGSVGWPGTGLGLSLGSSGTLGSSLGNGLSGSPIPPFGGSMYHNFNFSLQLWPNLCQ